MDSNVVELKQVAVAVKGATLGAGRRVGPSGKVEVRCTVSGKWYVENQGGIRAYTTDEGVRWICVIRIAGFPQQQQGGFPSWKEANNWKGKRVGEIRGAVNAAHLRGKPDRMTIPQLFAFYVADRERLSATSAPKQPILDMFRRVGAHPLFCNLLVSDLTAEVVQQYCRSRKDVDGCAPATILGEYARLSMVLGYVIDAKKWALFNPLNKHLRRKLHFAGLIGQSVERERRPSEEELRQLHAYFGAEWQVTNKLPMNDLIDFACINGFRRGEQHAANEKDEQYGLRFSQIDGAGIHCWRKDASSSATNGKRNCYVTLFPASLEIIERQRARVTGDLIFPYCAAWVSKVFTKACKDLRQQALALDPASKLFLDLRWHDLRHEAISTFAPLLSTADGMKTSGHKTEAHYRRYNNQKKPDAARVSLQGAPIRPKGY